MGKIRRMKENDLQEVVEIERLSFPSPWPKESFLLELQNPYSNLFVWEEEGEILGYIIWRVIAGEVHILNISVHPKMRRMGIGKKLMEFCLEEEKGSHHIFLEVRVSNKPAIKLYEKLGFRKIARIKNYYNFPKQDAFLMFKLL